MPPADLCSVVIPVYNGAQYLRETVESCLSQDYPAVEVILVDDASSDLSPDLMRALQAESPERVRIFFQPKNQGMVTTLLMAASQAQGKYICFLGQDDIMMKNRVSSQVAAMEKFSVSMVCSNAYYMMGTTPTKNFVHPDWLKEGFVQAEAFVWRNPIIGPAVMVRREDYAHIPAALFSYRHSMEWIHWIQYLDMRGIYYLPQPLIYYRRHGRNLSSSLNQTEEYRNYSRQMRRLAFSRLSFTQKLAFVYKKLFSIQPVSETVRDLRIKVP